MILFIVMAFIVLHMGIVWLWYRWTNNPSVVDVGWASGLTLSGLIYLSYPTLSTRSVILAIALLLWGARLGGYLWWTRIRKKKVDKRYLALSRDWKVEKPLGFFVNFQLQGVFIFVVSLCWYFTSLNQAKSLSTVDVLTLALFIFCLVLETVADLQLQRFRKTNPGQVCNQKLWRLCRHPNYFFEWLIWCAFSVFAFSSPYGVLGIVSPLALFLLMIFITIPITERESIKSRGEKYRQYQAITPKFFPKM